MTKTLSVGYEEGLYASGWAVHDEVQNTQFGIVENGRSFQPDYFPMPRLRAQ
ncbi:hypothetical protein ACT691_17285 [Vibrio metschnikovii]